MLNTYHTSEGKNFDTILTIPTNFSVTILTIPDKIEVELRYHTYNTRRSPAENHDFEGQATQFRIGICGFE